jgi:HAD superfamily hydrolase (TIGR01509 family)
MERTGAPFNAAACSGPGARRESAAMLRAVIFDVGETLVDETRAWGEWADWLGTPRLTFFAALGSLVERGLPHRQVFAELRPDLDLDELRAQVLRAGRSPGRISASDLYPDARACLEELRARGYWIAVAGNQPASAERELRALGLAADLVVASESFGVAKPEPEFFARLVKLAGCAPGEIAYVGDRLDNDVLPALAAGMRAVFLRRGPWGIAHARRSEAARADARIETLAELPDLLDRLGRRGP